jgi:undecaprenyl phosphate N,N'-diacetylbacillosamine 1-phosphate transferase
MQTKEKLDTRLLFQQGNLYRKFFKRPMDFILSLLALIIASPILLIIAILIRIKLGSPVIFKQKRPGLNEEIFVLYKFRTMTNEKDGNGNLLPDEARLTRFGKLLRSTSMDELPELWNILKGDMSFVGPRPQLIKDLVFMSPEQRRRHEVKPGLTGWAQINGRNRITWEERLKLDLEYIGNVTFLGDWKIIFRTIVKVFKREGISSDGMDTTEDYGDYLLRVQKISETEYYSSLKENKELMMKII